VVMLVWGCVAHLVVMLAEAVPRWTPLWAARILALETALCFPLTFRVSLRLYRMREAAGHTPCTVTTAVAVSRAARSYACWGLTRHSCTCLSQAPMTRTACFAVRSCKMLI
jgi:hypothetical protein